MTTARANSGNLISQMTNTMKTRLSAMLGAAALVLSACAGTPAETGENDANPEDRWQSELERDTSPGVDRGTLEELAAANRDFAFDLLRQIRAGDPGGNVFYSPHSISLALAMAYAGASGETREELARVLRFILAEEELHPAFNALDLDLATRGEAEVDDGDPPVLRIVNATWGQSGYPFSETYLDTLARNYGSGLTAMDFAADPEGSRQRINRWVEEQTEERIRDLLPDGSIDPRTRLVLTNAIYFLAGWQHAFNEDATDERPFTLLDGTEVDVPLMRQNEMFAFYEGERTRAVSLPYVGGELSFIALKPADPGDFDAWAESLDREHFDRAVEGLSHGHGTVVLPRFELEGEYDLKSLFGAMGWNDYTRLARMVGEGVPDELEISAILHKSFISVDEQGTEAAAATAVAIRLVAAPADPVTMEFNRPFVYAIYDHPTDSILFVGTMMNPGH